MHSEVIFLSSSTSHFVFVHIRCCGDHEYIFTAQSMLPDVEHSAKREHHSVAVVATGRCLASSNLRCVFSLHQLLPICISLSSARLSVMGATLCIAAMTLARAMSFPNVFSFVCMLKLHLLQAKHVMYSPRWLSSLEISTG